MANLSSAIIEARKRHEAEIAERLERRQQRQRAEIERLNSEAVSAVAASAPEPGETLGAVAPSEGRPVADPEARPAAEPETVKPPAGAPPAAHWHAVPAPQERARPERLARASATPLASLPVALTREAAQPNEPAPLELPAQRRHAPRPARVEVGESIELAARPDEVETPPDGRFLKLRNDIIDRVKPYLTGNQFAVYLEIYRQTIGRGRTGAWFRTREVQAACNLGSDNTVRDAYPVLEQKRLIKLDPSRRAGSPKGLFITVLSVERALERLERAGAAARPAVAASVLPAPLPADPAEPSLLETLTRTYGVSPSVAPQLLEPLNEDDWTLLPYMLARLDRSVASGKVHNPAGLLRVWLESFDAWRPELEADKARDEEAKRVAREALSKDELMVEWFRETEAEAERRFAGLGAAERAALEARGREELLVKSPAVRTWSDQQWAQQLEIFAKAELRRELGGFEAWLERRRSG